MRIIAEIGTGHMGNFNHAQELIIAASHAGADIIKFQHVYAHEIIAPNSGFITVLDKKIALYDYFKSIEQNIEFFIALAHICTQQNVEFLCSPFGLISAQELSQINTLKSIKIASPELNHIPLLHYVAKIWKNLIVSTGVSTLSDIASALDILYEHHIPPQNITLLHCITQYPAPIEHYNLRLIHTLRNICGINIGISDHSAHPIIIPCIAKALGSSILEKHFTLSHNHTGIDDPIAIEPHQFADMCAHLTAITPLSTEEYHALSHGQWPQSLDFLREYASIETLFAALGDGIKQMSHEEQTYAKRTQRSIHATRNLSEGTCIKKSDFALLRTEKELHVGMHPQFADMLIGKYLTRSIAAGQGVTLADIS